MTGISRRKLSSTTPSKKGTTIWRSRYRSRIFNTGVIRVAPWRPHDDEGRDSVAHAPAFLRGSGRSRAHPALGAAARSEGLLRDGRLAARVSAGPHDVQ